MRPLWGVDADDDGVVCLVPAARAGGGPVSAEGWTAVPTWLIRESDLTAVELAVLLVLLSRVNASGVCWPSVPAIAREARISPRSVHRVLDSLRTKGLVSWTQRRDDAGDLTSSVYRTHVEKPLKGYCHSGRTVVPQWQDGSATVAEGTTSTELDPPPGGGVRHVHEPNTRRALAALGVDVDALLPIAYAAGTGDPWAGYLALKPELDNLPAKVRDLPALLRTRLGLPKAVAR